MGAFLTFKTAENKKIKHTKANIAFDVKKNDNHTNIAMLNRQKAKEAFEIVTGLYFTIA